ncbi:hypothetical protein T4D_11814 [Trichinella pseudospiralis]|uniref:Uncharacterized protein n=1 Tax=Trichinella pseudospiralis TaxID=6337 RepID=A0A0V1FAQ3_TRIPS|nr:hypothetical protein T4D_11814 [Trichinella pseudospiralis]
MLKLCRSRIFPCNAYSLISNICDHDALHANVCKHVTNRNTIPGEDVKNLMVCGCGSGYMRYVSQTTQDAFRLQQITRTILSNYNNNTNLIKQAFSSEKDYSEI